MRKKKVKWHIYIYGCHLSLRFHNCGRNFISCVFPTCLNHFSVPNTKLHMVLTAGLVQSCSSLLTSVKYLLKKKKTPSLLQDKMEMKSRSTFTGRLFLSVLTVSCVNVSPVPHNRRTLCDESQHSEQSRVTDLQSVEVCWLRSNLWGETSLEEKPPTQSGQKGYFSPGPAIVFFRAHWLYDI